MCAQWGPQALWMLPRKSGEPPWRNTGGSVPWNPEGPKWTSAFLSSPDPPGQDGAGQRSLPLGLARMTSKPARFSLGAKEWKTYTQKTCQLGGHLLGHFLLFSLFNCEPVEQETVTMASGHVAVAELLSFCCSCHRLSGLRQAQRVHGHSYVHLPSSLHWVTCKETPTCSSYSSTSLQLLPSSLSLSPDHFTKRSVGWLQCSRCCQHSCLSNTWD